MRWHFALVSCVSVVGALCGVVLQPSGAEAAPPQWTVTRVLHDEGATNLARVSCSASTLCAVAGSGSAPIITRVRFKDSERDPTVVVVGTRFGSFPPREPANCGATGKNFPKHMLYLRDVTEDWDAGITGNCIGLKIETYSKTMIKFEFGNYYDTAPYFYVLAPGDEFDFVVKGTVATGVVDYT